MSKFTILSLVIFLLLAGVVFFPQTSPAPVLQDQKEVSLFEVIAQNMEVPWALAFLPDGNILVTERIGKVRIIKDGQLLQNPVITLTKVKQSGESGLHGIAIHPKYPQKPFVYLYYSYSSDEDNSLNRVSSFTFDGQSLKDEQILVDNIPGAVFHDGGRIKFGPDGFLYITTGDAQNPSLAQDKNSLAGKILRVTDPSASPSIPRSSGPRGSGQVEVEVYSYGHRNPQGITWDGQGRLWSTEHGSSATDEINLIEAGGNFGWPQITGDQKQQGIISPVLHSGQDTWAPAGVTFLNDSIYFAGLRGQALYQFKVDTSELKVHFKGQFGRIRDVVLGPDNMLYITTSNKDGRGTPAPNDDKIIRINPELL